MYSVITEYPIKEVTDEVVDEIDSLLTVSEAASLLHVHGNTIRNWSNSGILPSLRIGPRNDRRYWKRDLTIFLSK
jgi:excisionase family DNA binding protein